MPRVIVSLAFAVSLMHSATAIAEEEKPEPVRYTSISDLVVPTSYLYTLDREYYLDDLEFQDNSPLGRISRIRQLPLLTLSGAAVSILVSIARGSSGCISAPANTGQ